jgi:hypothetical protein
MGLPLIVAQRIYGFLGFPRRISGWYWYFGVSSVDIDADGPLIIIIIIIIMALQSFVGPWPIFHFLDPLRTL